MKVIFKQTRLMTALPAMALAIAFGVIAPVNHARAGGLFGDGGVFRGDVGRFVQNNVNPVVTPILRDQTRRGAAFAGTAIGTYYGGPAGGMVGGAVGNAVGGAINNAFAGQDLFDDELE